MHEWFNLIAELIAYLIDQIEMLPELKNYSESLDPEQDEASKEEAEKILKESKNELDSPVFDKKAQGFHCIIEKVKQINNFYVGRYVLSMMDQKIPWRTIADEYTEPFEALNENIKQTGILVLPRAAVIVPVHQERPVKPADRFYPLLEEALVNLYFVHAKKLHLDGRQYRLQNMICYPDMDLQQCANFRIVYSPLLGKKTQELLNIQYGKIQIGQYQYNSFAVNSVKSIYEQSIEKLYGRLLKYACEMKADLVCSCEMLGVKNLYDVDSFGYNDFIYNLLQEIDNVNVPKLILPPTYSFGHKNSLRVFDESGKMLLTQDKQFEFHYSHDGTRYVEDLRERNSIIWILHIPGWGRIVFPICRDFIETLYRELLIRDLKSTIVICPSFSSGNRDFERDLAAIRPFGANVFWGNTCLCKEQHWSGFVGAAENASIGQHSGVKRLNPTCTDNCTENCVFVIDFPLDYAGKDRHNDIGIEVKCDKIF